MFPDSDVAPQIRIGPCHKWCACLLIGFWASLGYAQTATKEIPGIQAPGAKTDLNGPLDNQGYVKESSGQPLSADPLVPATLDPAAGLQSDGQAGAASP